MTKTNSQKTDGIDSKTEEKQICGIIMPISPTDGYSATHWAEVMQIIEMVVIDSGFKPNIVSDADDVGIIHNRIVNNLAENPIVICDVSSKNPNVMFELGLRLAFDKATLIIKDELTSYNFDTSPIEHLGYPSDLHYHKIEEFKVKLKKKLLSTYEASKTPGYSTFLKNFVNYKRELETESISDQEYIVKQFDRLFERISRLENSKVGHPDVITPTSTIRLQNELVDLYLSYIKTLTDDERKDFLSNHKSLKAELFLSNLIKNNFELIKNEKITTVRNLINAFLIE